MHTMSKKYRILIAFLITIILMVVIGVIVFNKMNEGIDALVAEEPSRNRSDFH